MKQRLIIVSLVVVILIQGIFFYVCFRNKDTSPEQEVAPQEKSDDTSVPLVKKIDYLPSGNNTSKRISSISNELMSLLKDSPRTDINPKSNYPLPPQELMRSISPIRRDGLGKVPPENQQKSSLVRIEIKLESQTENGIIYPRTSFSIEDENGRILKKGITDSKGAYQGILEVSEGTLLYYRLKGAMFMNRRYPLSPLGTTIYSQNDDENSMI